MHDDTLDDKDGLAEALAATFRRQRAFAPSTVQANPPARALRDRRVFEAGQVVADTYVIRDVIGQGGMGQVYEAFDRVIARRVALKASWPDVPPSVLQREAQALAAIKHPAAVTVHACGSHEGTWFVVMELLHGVTLDAHIARAGRLTAPAATDLLIALAEALAAVHDAGIAHRDLKPSNIMLLPKGRLVLLDFGLFGADGAAAGVLDVCGTPDYMAPETARGDVRPRNEFLVDLYALGVVGFEMLTGQLPLAGEDGPSTMMRQVNSVAPRARQLRSDVPTALDELIHELLEKSPEARPQSAGNVVDRLRSIRRDLPPERFKVLVVDDDPTVSRVLAHYATKSAPDVEVAVAADARTALRLIAEAPPDLALVDLQMPHMSGLEFVMYLEGAHLAVGCEIVVVSAGAQPGDVELLRSLGVTKVIRKDGTLRSDVAACVRQARARRFGS